MCKYNIFDSHAHYDDESFDSDREEIFKDIDESKIVGILNCGSSMEGAIKSVHYAKTEEKFYGAVGIHPENTNDFTVDNKEKIISFLSEKKVVAIGEIGLDYYWNKSNSEVQKKIFIEQMEIAREYKLPVIIHDRDAHEDTLKILKMFKGVEGVMHCFSGSVEFSRECIKLGYYIGFGGVVTFKNAKKILEVVKDVPVEKILVETDCPYMAPEPYRGKRNMSKYIDNIIDKISFIKSLNSHEISGIFVQNAKCLLNI